MRKVLLALVGGVVLTGCLAEQEKRQIVVDGQAKLEFQPEQFSLSGKIRSRTNKRADALAEIATTLQTIRDTIPRLEGLEKISIDASEATLKPVNDSGCEDARAYNEEAVCPVEGFFGEIEIKVSGSPASHSGSVLSLLSEMGTESTSLNGYAIEDASGARKQAIAVAMKDARSKADKLAAAAGATVVGPLKVQFGRGFAEYLAYREEAIFAGGATENRFKW